MRQVSKEAALAQVERLLQDHQRLQSRPREELTSEEIWSLLAGSRAAVERIAGPDSAYAAEVQRILERSGYDTHKPRPLAGVLMALLADIKADALQSFGALHHAELYADY